MVKIRLSRHGSNKKPFYKIIVTDSRSPRNGRFIEKIGFFNPILKNKENSLKINLKKIQYWISVGAKMSNKVKKLNIKYKKIING
ncbi:MAG: 30S ribosomal protein S16 [Buchnera aphidicola (Periphyllus lyropictus)]|uniref:30S ribosomal protein S16 n=1 Tax=Buchnera aphidicola TaxID=9 RepID=UPI001EBF83FE|nr:30S ribosomal protein S16 [Buchnera aphidicola]NIH16560.1 30S ribosomal protein S16 [Buchnera aphidicola (Periphyllus lyropictus)]USS94453.1 30S ribosomal protein S16 [Buchnera aphidicola (Periphyllus lyropictus)]